MGFFEALAAKLKELFPDAKDDVLAGIANDAALKAAFDEDQSIAIDEAVTALQGKNNDLIKEKRALQLKVKSGTKEDLDDYEAKVNALTEQVATLTGQVTAKDRELNRANTKLKTDTEKLSGDLKVERDRNITSMRDTALMDAVSQLDLANKDLLPLVKSHFASALTVIEEGGERKVVAKYIGADGKEAQLPATDYAAYWAGTAEGLATVKAKAAGGAGDFKSAGGTQKKGQQKETVADPFADLKFD